MPDKQGTIPNINRLSILVSIILLAYTLTHFVSIPTLEFDITFIGVYIPLRIRFSTLVTLLVAGITASGSAWLLQDHPASDVYRTTAVHWLLPSLTSLVLMLAIEQLPFGGIWWVAAFSSGIILILVYIAEYIVLDSNNPYYSFAEIGISALSIALFLIMAIAMHQAEIRLFFRVPLISIAAALVYLRVIHLRQKGFWAITQGSVAFLIIGELAAGFHYWPINSISFGLALAGSLYTLIEVSDYIQDPRNIQSWKIFIWPGLILIISWGIALLL